MVSKNLIKVTDKALILETRFRVFKPESSHVALIFSPFDCQKSVFTVQALPEPNVEVSPTKNKTSFFLIQRKNWLKSKKRSFPEQVFIIVYYLTEKCHFWRPQNLKWSHVNPTNVNIAQIFNVNRRKNGNSRWKKGFKNFETIEVFVCSVHRLTF